MNHALSPNAVATIQLAGMDFSTLYMQQQQLYFITMWPRESGLPTPVEDIYTSRLGNLDDTSITTALQRAIAFYRSPK